MVIKHKDTNESTAAPACSLVLLLLQCCRIFKGTKLWNACPVFQLEKMQHHQSTCNVKPQVQKVPCRGWGLALAYKCIRFDIGASQYSSSIYGRGIHQAWSELVPVGCPVSFWLAVESGSVPDLSFMKQIMKQVAHIEYWRWKIWL